MGRTKLSTAVHKTGHFVRSNVVLLATKVSKGRVSDLVRKFAVKTTGTN